jgi:hypothetical protein
MSGPRTVADGFQEFALWANDPTPRIPWGMPFFDMPTGGGIARSEIAMLMSMSSVGKTSIGLNIIRNNPEIPALFMSLEMSWRQVVVRLAAMEHGVSTQSIEQEIRTQEGYFKYAQGVVDRYRWLICDDTPALSLKDAKSSFRRATELLGGHAPRLVIWDYMELIGGSGLMNKSEAVDRAAQKLRDWTRELDTSSVVLHQVGKGDDTGGYKPLSLESGRYGGHQPMDYVVGAYAARLNPDLTEAEFKAGQPELYLQLLKNRSGGAIPTGRKYHQDPITMRIEPWGHQAFYGSFQPTMGVS